VRIGTRHERASEAGVSHYLEHMLFKGTGKRSALEIAREVDRVGGEFNAFTTREHTCFHLLLLGHDVELAIDILRDILLDSKFDATEMERERKVILQEISMVDETPEELAHDVFFEQIYGKHGMGKPILGTETGIRRMSRRTLVEYFRRHYRPDQLVVAVAGNVAHEKVAKKLGALLKRDWPGRARKRIPKAAFSTPAPKVRSGFWWLVRPTEQVHLIWGVEGPKLGHKDRFAAFLLNVYLGGGMSSALFQEIREKNGLAYTVYSSLSSYIDTGVFSIYAATGMNQVPLCLRLIEESVGRLKKDLLKEEELQIVKDNLKGTILLESDNVETRMSSIAKNEITFGKYISVDEVCAEIDRVRPEDVRRMARRLLGHGDRSVLFAGPKPTRALAQKLKPLGVRILKR
jgi:predicted Zn-dependent peptidase